VRRQGEMDTNEKKEKRDRIEIHEVSCKQSWNDREHWTNIVVVGVVIVVVVVVVVE
jgi:hypothetical protein